MYLCDSQTLRDKFCAFDSSCELRSSTSAFADSPALEPDINHHSTQSDLERTLHGDL